MRQFSNFQWILILAACAFVVLIVGLISLYFRLNPSDLLPQSYNDSTGSWAFGVFWVIHTPLIFILSRHFSFKRRHLFRSVLIYLSVGIVWTMIVQGLPLLFLPVLSNSMSFNSHQFQNLLINWFGTYFLINLLIYWLVLSISLISSYYEQYQKEKLKASQLDVQLSNARLQALKMQLHPHFLFNTLHSISALVLKNENRDAVKMINRLSELLRLTLDNIETQVFTLEDEIEFTRRYLEIECIRFQDRLTIEWEIEPQALIAEVPALILQPLVENAMRHGVDSHSGSSRIMIEARLQNNQLLMEIRDDGKDVKKISEQSRSGGLGLKNTRERLSELYGEDYSFNLSRTKNDWTIAKITFPFNPAKDSVKGESN